eukprot:1082445_1
MAEAKQETAGSFQFDLLVSIDEASACSMAVRYPCACAIDSGSILIFGGYDNMNQGTSKSSSKVWFYNASINQYFEMKPLPYDLCGGAAAKTPFTKKDDHQIEELPYDIGEGPSIVFDNNNNLHILGGRTGNNQQHLMIQWDTDKTNRKIIDLGNAPNACCYAGIIQHQNKLYIMGSYEGKKDSLWIYDLNNKSWKSGPNIPLARSGFGCHLINKHQDIILIGDGYGKEDSDVILLYNIQTNKWRTSKTKLKHTIGFHASALLADRGEIHGFSGYSKDKNVNTHFVVKYKQLQQ